MPTSLGVDVGVRKGLDLVLMGEGGELLEMLRGVLVEELGGLIRRMRPDLLAIDSPPAWGLTGRSRSAERVLAASGIRSFATPSDPRMAEHTFYQWMKVGFRCFRLSARHGFPRYRKGPVKGAAMEVFPHPSATVLSGLLPPSGVSKRAWRHQVLEQAGVAVEHLRSLDQADAALAALTGIRALSREFMALGDPEEGVIVLPAAKLPEGRFPRAASAPAASPPLQGG